MSAPVPLAQDPGSAACAEPRVLAGLAARISSGPCNSQAMEIARR